MKCTVYRLGELRDYKFVVIFARYRNKWLLCKHRERNTWETAGGHIESGEMPQETAKRELYEETGSIDFDIKEVFDYWACDEPHETEKITWANGQVFLAEIRKIGAIPEGSEMECIDFFDIFPQNLTYLDITRELLPQIITRI
ncbi:NUDIX domain-containing protein [Treponema sp. OttesenSCG-928-L16]|nr:NUDIX domain-containing protein [Treponema sp. OttesenSCG-928-L16]